MALIEA